MHFSHNMCNVFYHCPQGSTQKVTIKYTLELQWSSVQKIVQTKSECSAIALEIVLQRTVHWCFISTTFLMQFAFCMTVVFLYQRLNEVWIYTLYITHCVSYCNAVYLQCNVLITNHPEAVWCHLHITCLPYREWSLVCISVCGTRAFISVCGTRAFIAQNSN